MECFVIVMGAGGHGRVLIKVLLEQGFKIIGITEDNQKLHGQYIKNLKVIGNDEVVLEYQQQDIYLINGLGMIGLDRKRQGLFERFKNLGYSFARVIHPTAIIDEGVKLGEGLQVMAGAIIQVGSSLGNNTIVNTGAIVEHECRIGSHVHLATGATLTGGVRVGDGCLIGAGVTVINGIEIGEHCLVGAGAVVTKNLAPGSKVRGVPARQY